MVYVRGNPNDYERWSSFGLKDWSMKSTILEIETWSEGENEYRGGKGIFPVNCVQKQNPLFKAFIDSAEAGYDRNKDMNGKYKKVLGCMM